ncbi:MAG: transcription-repair coupling factor [Acidaminococcaceae bacterium]|nr:transcription-repair coupling factor [Acidaminococcaceae bacterium]
MRNELLALLKKITIISDIAAIWQAGKKSINITGLGGPVKTGLLCALKDNIGLQGPLIFLLPRRDDIRSYRRELNYFYPDLAMRELYPADLLAAKFDAQSKELLAERISALELIRTQEKSIIFVTAEAFVQKLPKPESLFKDNLVLRVGMEIEQEEVLTALVNMGYERAEQVDTRGQFSLRGDILDIFAINTDEPLRVEWFDNMINAMRSFDYLSQRSLVNFSQAEVVPIVWKKLAGQVDLFAYVEKSALVVLDEPVEFFSEIKKLSDINKEHEINLFTPEQVIDFCSKHKLLVSSALPHPYFSKAMQVTVPVRTMAPYNRNTELLTKDLKGWQDEGLVPLIMMSTAEKAAGLAESLSRQGINIHYVKQGEKLTEKSGCVFVGELANGFRFWNENWLLLTESDIFGVQKKRRLTKHKQAGAQIQYFSEIKEGDYVVHVVHGIGRYVGVKTIEVDGVHRDYLYLQYAKDDKLYVPIEQVNLLHKYIGNENQSPRLSRIGGADWQRVTNKAKKAITELATELLRLYAQRKIVPGYAFSKDTQWQKDFEASFPFEETPDQINAVEEIKRDMERDVPMERLLCGDVGYGKTEVAIRAAFKAVMDGKQVAVLAPTTVLAQQHLLTFTQRMEPFGVRVDMLSRFRTPSEQKQVLAKMEEGQIDVLIGTHRILQPDIRFPDLGLLIIDEEQRFGVAQKEKMKKWTTGVDVLTLSATPIPRTLHLALVKGKDMSIIESPPEERLPVETYVAEYNDGMIKEALEREIRRGGRIYYVHNRVQGLEAIAKHLHNLVPGISIRIAHGQMPEDMLEDAMIGFYEGQFDLLLCTTIIENGLDVPLANTIIIDGAENFGLSQLYQMRGRVGRSSRLAYAYFVYKRQRVLSEIAQKRLQAIRDFTELGAGFKIAMRDLEIRGAGNLLGAEQHGHIAGIGFAAYCSLLEKTINSLKNGVEDALPEPDPVLEIVLDAYIPDDYIANPRYKMEIYRRCSELIYEDREDLLDEIIDRFGEPPVEVVNLWRVAVLRSLCRLLKIMGISVKQNEVRINFGEKSIANPEGIMKLVKDYAPGAQFKNGLHAQLLIRKNQIEKQPLEWLEKALVNML